MSRAVRSHVRVGEQCERTHDVRQHLEHGAAQVVIRSRRRHDLTVLQTAVLTVVSQSDNGDLDAQKLDMRLILAHDALRRGRGAMRLRRQARVALGQTECLVSREAHALQHDDGPR